MEYFSREFISRIIWIITWLGGCQFFRTPKSRNDISEWSVESQRSHYGDFINIHWRYHWQSGVPAHCEKIWLQKTNVRNWISTDREHIFNHAGRMSEYIIYLYFLLICFSSAVELVTHYLRSKSILFICFKRHGGSNR